MFLVLPWRTTIPGIPWYFSVFRKSSVFAKLSSTDSIEIFGHKMGMERCGAVQKVGFGYPVVLQSSTGHVRLTWEAIPVLHLLVQRLMLCARLVAGGRYTRGVGDEWVVAQIPAFGVSKPTKWWVKCWVTCWAASLPRRCHNTLMQATRQP